MPTGRMQPPEWIAKCRSWSRNISRVLLTSSWICRAACQAMSRTQQCSNVHLGASCSIVRSPVHAPGALLPQSCPSHFKVRWCFPLPGISLRRHLFLKNSRHEVSEHAHSCGYPISSGFDHHNEKRTVSVAFEYPNLYWHQASQAALRPPIHTLDTACQALI